MPKRLAVAIAAALIASGAAAQPAAGPPGPTPPTAAARAEAERLIAAAGASDVFEVASAGEFVAARHLPSRVICRFEAGSPGNRILVVPGPRPRGHEVECATSQDGDVTTLRMTLDNPPVSADAALERTARLLAERYPGAKRSKTSPEAAQASAGPGAQTRHARFDITEKRRPRVVQVHLAQFGGWTVEQHTTGDRDDPILELTSGLDFSTTTLVWMADIQSALK